MVCCIAAIFDFILELLADLTERTPNRNTVNISQVKRYRNLISTSIYRSHTTIAFKKKPKTFELFTVGNTQLFTVGNTQLFLLLLK